MRIIKYTVLMSVCSLIHLMAYLVINNFHSDRMSLKTCVLMAAPLFIWVIYQRVNTVTK
jgi:uncharacterized membrane protein (GlpM family)